VLIKEAQRTAEEIASAVLQCFAELHADLLAELGAPFAPVLRTAVRQAAVRRAYCVADWWAQQAHARSHAAQTAAPPRPLALVRRAHGAAGILADEVLAYLSRPDRNLLAGLGPEMCSVLRVAILHAGVRWLCCLADWWWHKSQVGPDDDV
jgi:hypothetical protein